MPAITQTEYFEYKMDDIVVDVRVDFTPGSDNMTGRHPDDMLPNDPDEIEIIIEFVNGIRYCDWCGKILEEDLQEIERMAEEMFE